MHTQNETPENHPSIARLIRSADVLLRTERHEALASAAINPRAVRALRRIAAHPEAPAPTGHRAGRLHRFVDAGLVSVDDDGVRLTDAGAAMLAQADAALADLDARAFAPVDADDLRTALTTVIDALGGQERLRSLRHERRAQRGNGFGRGFGRGFGHGFGRDHGHSEHRGRRGFGPARRDCGHGAGHDADHRGHHRGQHRRHDERAFERGFVAGAAFASGHDADH